MSVILNALKKLDRDKSSRRNGTSSIAREILRSDLPRRGKRILLYFGAVSFGTAALTYVLMVQSGFLSKSSPPAALSPPAAGQQVSPAPIAHEPLPQARDEISRVPPKVQEPAERKKPASPAGEQKTSRDVISEETAVAPGNVRKPAEHTLKGSATPPWSLTLSGTVWTEEPSTRLAVINGTITSEGSVIEGVKVVEIYPDRVRLLRNSRSFEILVGTSYGNRVSEE